MESQNFHHFKFAKMEPKKKKEKKEKEKNKENNNFSGSL